MEKYSPKAYYDFKRGSELAKQSNTWSYIGLGGLLVGLLSSNIDNALLGYSVGTRQSKLHIIGFWHLLQVQ